MKYIMNTFHIMKFIFNFITGQCSRDEGRRLIRALPDSRVTAPGPDRGKA